MVKAGQNGPVRTWTTAEGTTIARKRVARLMQTGDALQLLFKGSQTRALMAKNMGLAHEVAPRAEQLKSDFNAAIAQLQQAVSVVVGNVASIRSGAGEISQAADDLSRRTEQQAASLEETAAALDQITATVRKTAENAQAADGVVTQGRSQAETGGVVVQKAVAAMGPAPRDGDDDGGPYGGTKGPSRWPWGGQGDGGGWKAGAAWPAPRGDTWCDPCRS